MFPADIRFFSRLFAVVNKKLEFAIFLSLFFSLACGDILIADDSSKNGCIGENNKCLVAGDKKNDEYDRTTYKSIGKYNGVWNRGKAAFWDIDLIDHFHYFGPPQRVKGYKPKQPISFSHVTHVQKNKMECQFCHWSVAKSPYANIPEVETCKGCHQIQVQGTTDEQKAEIKKLQEYFSGNGKPIPWEKVHVMPDYVKFNHKRHGKAGVTCQECHGQVPEMDVVERVTSMKMGWCISCHRERGASIDCLGCHH
ncbi:MAG TPA: cytochrome c3 family protein [Oligoflexia bacterium]|nr:cytochrome c3 family protein [Oligoflexia bacterium]HMP26695.1 cytochrome c3 family protein [Oligoflexia bacterium]